MKYWPKSPLEAVSSALEWAGKHLDLRCLPPAASFSVPQWPSIQLELRLRGKRKQKDHSYDVGESQHARPGPRLFRPQSEDLYLQGRPVVLWWLVCAIGRRFCFCWHWCCFWVGLTLSEWVSMGRDRRAGYAEFSVIRPKAGDEALKRQEGDIRGGEEP